MSESYVIIHNVHGKLLQLNFLGPDDVQVD